MQMASRLGLQWGTQIAWTYGPYGYTDQAIYVYFRTWLLAAVVAVVVHVLYCGVLGLFLWQAKIGIWGWSLAAVLLLLPLQLSLEFFCFATLILLLYLGLLVTRTSAAHLAFGVAGLLLAFLCLVRGTAILSAPLLVVAVAVTSYSQRRPALILTFIVAAVVTFLVLWGVANQRLTGLPEYLRTSYELSSGYSSAMSLVPGSWGPLRHAYLIPGIGLVCATVLIGLIATFRRDAPIAIIACLALAVLFVGYKEGFVRAALSHETRFFTEAILVQSPMLFLAVRRRARCEAALAIVAVSAAGVLLVFSARAMGPGAPAALGIQNVPERLSTYPQAIRMVVDPAERQRITNEDRANVRAATKVPDSIVAELRQGTVDVVPAELDIVYGYGLNWVPRPVLQSYSAYTDYLDGLDASHFTGSTAPDYVLFQLGAIDGRYPLFEEPRATWALLHEYRVAEVSGTYVVLVRGRSQRQEPSAPMGEVTAPLGAVVSVPNDAPDVRASIQLSYSPRGNILNLLAAPGAVHVRFLYGDGNSSPEYRLVPNTAAHGAPVGWYVAETAALVKYVDGHPTGRINGMVLTTDDPGDYSETYHVSFAGS